MAQLGGRLYRALNGPEGRLASLPPNSTIELAIPDDGPAASASLLSHTAWELLHDDAGYLAQRGIIPVRTIGFGSASASAAPAEQPPPPANRPLRLLFMACSPVDVRPVLPFETEERIFLDATAGQPMYLTPEETGSVEQLEETARTFDAFDIFHLTGHGDLYNEQRHQHYLREDQTFAESTPVLLTEDDRGRCLLATAQDLESAFGPRLPRLVFLSGCRTGELPGQQPDAAVRDSLAQDLLRRGFPAVLGWARPVLDFAATQAAGLLYRELASGSTVEEALRITLKEASSPNSDPQSQYPFSIPQWHFLRLFTIRGQAQAALVTVPSARGRAKYEKPRLDEGFLDHEKKLKVAGFRRFVGRRRPLQRTLPALDFDSDYTGVAIWGIGGLGKSSLAARLCDRVERRRPQFRRIVLVGLLDETRLLGLLRAKYADHDALTELDASGRSLSGRLMRFLDKAESDAPLLLVFDDFEQNIELDGNAQAGLRLKPEAFRVLESVCGAIREKRAQSRVILTSRYWNVGAYPPDARFLPEQLPQMDVEELRKKARVDIGSKDEKDKKEAERVVGAAQGVPRLFDWLIEYGPGAEEQAADAYRKYLTLSDLVAKLSPDEQSHLATLSVFNLPVSTGIANSTVGVEPEKDPFERAVNLGLAERAESIFSGGQRETIVPVLVRPALANLLSADQWKESHGAAARAAYSGWWEGEGGATEPRVVEIVRLALEGGEQRIACDLAERLAVAWNNQNRYSDTEQLLTGVLAHFEDHRLYSSIALAERTLGNTQAALKHLDRARELSREDERGNAFALYQHAGLRAQQGDLLEALALYKESLEINQRLANEQGISAILAEMAGLKAQQGDVAGALKLYRQSLEITERTEDGQGKAATLSNMAGLRAQQGDVGGALELFWQSLEIQDRIGDAKGKAATLGNMAGLRVQQGDVGGALELYRQSLTIKERIGDAKGKAATLTNMAGLSAQQGDVVEALELYRQSLEITEHTQDAQAKAATLGNMAGLRAQQGDVGGALELCRQALAIKERIGDEKGRAATLHAIAGLIAQQGDVSEALELYRQSLEIEDRIGNARGKAATLHAVAGLSAQQGDVGGALELYRQALDIEVRIGDVQGKAATLHQMAGLRVQQGDVGGALELYRQSRELEDHIGNAKGQAATLNNIAYLSAKQGDVGGALELYRQSLEISERIGDVQGKAATLANMAALAHQQGDKESATSHSVQAAQILVSIRAWSDAMNVLGNLSVIVPDRRLHWLVQASWLPIALRLSAPNSLRRVSELFNVLPAAHPLELPLAALAFLLFANHGPEELRKQNREQAWKLLSIAAGNQSMTQEAFDEYLRRQLENPVALITSTLTSLEQLAPETWIYDRRQVLHPQGNP